MPVQKPVEPLTVAITAISRTVATAATTSKKIVYDAICDNKRLVNGEACTCSIDCYACTYSTTLGIAGECLTCQSSSVLLEEKCVSAEACIKMWGVVQGRGVYNRVRSTHS